MTSCWGCSVLSTKFSPVEGFDVEGSFETASRGLRFYSNHGVQVVNMSFGADIGTTAYNAMRGLLPWQGRPIREGGFGWGEDWGEITTLMFPGDPLTGAFWSELNIDGNGTALHDGSRVIHGDDVIAGDNQVNRIRVSFDRWWFGRRRGRLRWRTSRQRQYADE